MTEIDVTLTDYGLTVLCSWFAWNLWKQFGHKQRLQKLWMVFFGSIAVASFTGGTVHGYYLEESTLGYRLLWPTTLLAIGVTAATTWMLTGILISGPKKARAWTLFSMAIFMIYSGVVIFYSQTFTIVILNYLPAMVALLIASGRRFWLTREKHFLFLSCGILVGFAAVAAQQAGVAINPNYFNHNSTYHVIQALSLLILFRSVVSLLKQEGVHV